MRTDSPDDEKALLPTESMFSDTTERSADADDGNEGARGSSDGHEKVVEEKKAKRIRANRISAARSRQKKVEQRNTLEQSIRELMDEIVQLQPELEQLKQTRNGLQAEQAGLQALYEHLQKETSEKEMRNSQLRKQIQGMREGVYPADSAGAWPGVKICFAPPSSQPAVPNMLLAASHPSAMEVRHAPCTISAGFTPPALSLAGDALMTPSDNPPTLSPTPPVLASPGSRCPALELPTDSLDSLLDAEFVVGEEEIIRVGDADGIMSENWLGVG